MGDDRRFRSVPSAQQGSGLTFIYIIYKVYTSYIRSKRILGVAYIIFAVSISQFTFFDLRINIPNIAVALPLSYFYLEAILFGMSFTSLLDRHYINRRRLRVDFGLYAVFLVVTWSGAVLATGRLRTAVLVGCSVWFFIVASEISIRFLKTYRRSVRKLDDFYSDNTAVFVRWLHKSTYGIIFLGLCGSVFAFAPKWGNAIFMSTGIVMFVYIYVSFQNYILNYINVETAVESEIAPAQCEESESQESALKEAVGRWVEDGGYRQQGVTLDDVARAVGSNRSYVSACINTGYGLTFREWINGLRMEYAKKLLAGPEMMTVEKVSEESGFSTSAYFCRQFMKREGVTPSRWRETNRHNT